MTEKQRVYAAIDLKSFYASVECQAKYLDPLNVNLVVADESRTDKTICLAVSPALKSFGVPGRARLFEVKQIVKEVNRKRLRQCGYRSHGKSINKDELDRDPGLEVDFLTAVPRMAEYMAVSRKIYGIYLRYIAPEDIYVYSIDEVFIDMTDYLKYYGMNAYELCEKMIHEVLEDTGITATAGIGTNMYLAKVAMDIVAKHIPADRHGVRIAELDELSYRQLLWAHEPLTDFWRIGKGIARRLNEAGMYTMGDIARKALENEGLFYDLFGVNAEYLIDHAFGEESTTIRDIKNYTPDHKSISIGQVLPEGYPHNKGGVIIKEMSEALANDLLKKGMISDSIMLYIGYDIANLNDPFLKKSFEGEVAKDWYGRTVPRSATGSVQMKVPTNSAHEIGKAMVNLYESITDKNLLIRRVNIGAGGLRKESEYHPEHVEQLDLFSDLDRQVEAMNKREEDLRQERKVREAVLTLQEKFGKNAVLKGMNYEKGATARERNKQIGGHKA